MIILYTHLSCIFCLLILGFSWVIVQYHKHENITLEDIIEIVLLSTTGLLGVIGLLILFSCKGLLWILERSSKIVLSNKKETFISYLD